MKRFFIPALVLLLILYTSNACTNRPATVDLSGTWSSSTATSEFTLTLVQKTDTISGTHCSVMQNGNRIDCADDDELSIKGTRDIGSDRATVNFKSFSSGTVGKATIKLLSDTTMEWKIIEKPADDFYIPAYAVLKNN